jgi:mannose-binding lectin
LAESAAFLATIVSNAAQFSAERVSFRRSHLLDFRYCLAQPFVDSLGKTTEGAIMAILSAVTSGTQSTNSGSFVPIPGLTLSLPEGVGISGLVILNLPNPFAQGNNTPGGLFGISVNGTVSPVVASFTYNEAVPPSTGRIPTTLVLAVPLTTTKQVIQGMWQGVRGSKVIIDSPATLSVVVA